MESVSEISAEVNGGRTYATCVEENDCIGLQMPEPPTVKDLSSSSSVSRDASSPRDSVGGVPVPMSNWSSNREKDCHHWNDEESTIGLVFSTKDCKESDSISSDQEFPQKDGKECRFLSCEPVGDVISENKDTTSFCHLEENRIGRSHDSVGPCSSEVVDFKNNKDRFACFPRKEKNTACKEVDLAQFIDDCAQNELLLERHDSCVAVRDTLEDEQIQVEAGVLMPVFSRDAFEIAHIADQKGSVQTAQLAELPSDDFCEDEKLFGTHGSNLVTLSLEPTLSHDKEANLVTASETADSILQGLPTEAVKNFTKEGCERSYDFTTQCETISGTSICDNVDIKPLADDDAFNAVAETCDSASQSETVVFAETRESLGPLTKVKCNVTSANLIYDRRNGDEDSEASVYDLQDAKDFQQEHITQNMGENSNPVTHVSVAESVEYTEPPGRYDCKVSHENASGEDTLPGMNEGSVLEKHTLFGHLVTIDDARVESTKDNALCSGEDSVLAVAANMSAPFSMNQTLLIEEGTVNVDFSVKYRNVKETLSSHSEDRAANSTHQHCGHVADKDIGSSLDSTARNKLQQSDECIPFKDEELSSVGQKDSANTLPCTQPLKQQRKKIDIHHQFVREIVKIQHDREQYDKEQAERQAQAQQPANLLQVGCKGFNNKEHKGIVPEMQDIKVEESKQKALKDAGVHRQVKESTQSLSTKHEKSTIIQSRNEISHQRNRPQNSHEQAWPGHQSVKEDEKRSRGKQPRPFSVYRPPIAREALDVEHTNLRDSEAVNQQSADYAMNDSFDRSANVNSKSGNSMVASSPFIREGQSKVIRSNSEGSNTDSLEFQAEHPTHGMGIKVTFDTEKWQRRIHFSGGTGNSSEDALARPVVSRSSLGHGAITDSKFKPSASNHLQASKVPLKIRHQIEHGETSSKGKVDAAQVVRNVHLPPSHQVQVSSFSSARGQEFCDQAEVTDYNSTPPSRTGNTSTVYPLQGSKFSSRNRLIDHGETFKDNYYRSTQAANNGSLQGLASAESSQSFERAGKPSEKKSSFFERADNSANLRNLSSLLHRSPALAQRGSDNQGIPNIGARPEWSSGVPSPAMKSLSNPISQRPNARRPFFEDTFAGSTSVATINVRSEESKRSPMNMQGDLQHQQFSKSRFHDVRDNTKNHSTNDNSRLRKDSNFTRITKDFSSPFQAMLKDTNRPELSYAMPSQRSADTSQDFRGFGMSGHAKNHVESYEKLQRPADTSQDFRGFGMSGHAKNHVESYEKLQESLTSQPDASSRKAFTQNSQAQATSSPSLESLFCIMPIQEKWGDVVDDSTDSYDYLQFNTEDDTESESKSFSYGVANQSNTCLVDTKLSLPAFQGSNQGRGLPQNSYKDANSLHRHNELTREQLKYQTPGRRSVFERLGPQKNFQESILGPPPKIFDGRGVLKASPDALIRTVQNANNFKSPDATFYGSQWSSPSQAPSVEHENAHNNVEKDREVVVQAYTEAKQRRSRRELYVPRRGS